MELKNVTLLLTALCILSIVFIILVEFYQSQSAASFWNRPKSQLLVSRHAFNTRFKHGNDQVLLQTPTEGAGKHESWITKPNDYKLKGENNFQDSFSISMKDYVFPTEIRVRDLEKTTDRVTVTTSATQRKRAKMNKRQRLMKMKDYDGNLTEEERLKLSPYIYHEEEEKRRLSLPIVEKEFKYISYFMPWESSLMRKKSFNSCRFTKCAFVRDMSQADLVAFAANHLRDHAISPFKRPPGQRWLMYTIDPAIRNFDFDRDDIKSKFNATYTYNLDSDIPFIFGRLQRRLPSPIDYDLLFEQKTKMAAWFVSHCDTYSKREDYVERMQTVVGVDVFGLCGNMTCGGGARGYMSRSHDAALCLPMLTNTYKFYLSFENAYCLDYVTEKFFKLFQDIQVIPVVRGGFQYKKYLPSGIFVDADDFKSPKELAQYLVDLGNDKQRYTEMLRRKDEWGFVKSQSRECALCEYLHSNPPSQFYPDLHKKFGADSCFYPKKLK